MAKIDRKKIGLLHVAKKQLGLTDENYRDILEVHGGCRSSADLDEVGFERVMVYLTALGFRSTWTKRTFGHRAGMATPSQVEYIRRLWREYFGDDPSDRALNGWLKKFHGVSALRFVTGDKAKSVIPGLRAMSARPKVA